MPKPKKPVKADQVAKLFESSKTGLLVFKLPEEKEDFSSALNGWKYKEALRELDQHLRNQLKHKTLTDEVFSKVSEIRETLNEILKENDVDIYN